MDFLLSTDDYKNRLYKVTNVGKNIDYSCEEHFPGNPVMIGVFLQDLETGENFVVRVPQDSLEQEKIEKGSTVTVSKAKFWKLTRK